MSGVTVERRDHVLMTLRSPDAFIRSTFFSRCSSTNGPFFRLRGIALPPRPAAATAADDLLVGLLALATGPAFGLAPGRDRVTAARGLALTTAEGVVDRVHGDAAGVRTLALPPVATGLAQLHEAGLGVAHLSHGGTAVERHPTHLRRREPQRGGRTLLGDELDGSAGAAPELATRARFELDVVDSRADRDVAQREGVAGADLGTVTALEHVADLELGRRQDVALLPVEIVQQRNARVAVGVVLDRRDFGRYAVLLAAEVDDAVLL